MKRWFLAMALLPLLGCVNPATVDLNNGTFCSSENVKAYAKKHHMTYEQALDALRQESDSLWAEQEAKQTNQPKPKATVVPEAPTRAATP